MPPRRAAIYVERWRIKSVLSRGFLLVEALLALNFAYFVVGPLGKQKRKGHREQPDHKQQEFYPGSSVLNKLFEHLASLLELNPLGPEKLSQVGRRYRWLTLVGLRGCPSASWFQFLAIYRRGNAAGLLQTGDITFQPWTVPNNFQNGNASSLGFHGQKVLLWFADPSVKNIKLLCVKNPCFF